MRTVRLRDDWSPDDPWGIEEPDEVQMNGYSEETHIATIYFANAVQVWASLQEKGKASIGNAALAFNVSPDIILEAVNAHFYMFAAGDFNGKLNDLLIEHDGE